MAALGARRSRLSSERWTAAHRHTDSAARLTTAFRQPSRDYTPLTHCSSGPLQSGPEKKSAIETIPEICRLHCRRAGDEVTCGVASAPSPDHLSPAQINTRSQSRRVERQSVKAGLQNATAGWANVGAAAAESGLTRTKLARSRIIVRHRRIHSAPQVSAHARQIRRAAPLTRVTWGRGAFRFADSLAYISAAKSSVSSSGVLSIG